MKPTNKINLHVGTVFSGIGALEFALNRMKIPHIIEFAGDIDPLCQQTYFANYKISKDNWHEDICDFDATVYNGKIDLLMGGSPCQAFSTNGKRGGLKDSRGSLIFEFMRIIKESQPRVFIFENVRGLLIHNNGQTWETIMSHFMKLGYKLYLPVSTTNDLPLINATGFGIPQNRQRIYVVGFHQGTKMEKEFHFPTPRPLTSQVKDFLDVNVDEKYYLGQKGFEFVTSHPTRAQVNKPIMKCQKRIQQYNWNGDFFFEPLSHLENMNVPSRAWVGSWNGQDGIVRRLTPKECLRLMGFDETFKMLHNDTIMYNQIGNSVVVPVLEAIVAEILATKIFEGNA